MAPHEGSRCSSPMTCQGQWHQLSPNQPTDLSTTTPCAGTVLSLSRVLNGTLHKSQRVLAPSHSSPGSLPEGCPPSLSAVCGPRARPAAHLVPTWTPCFPDPLRSHPTAHLQGLCCLGLPPSSLIAFAEEQGRCLFTLGTPAKSGFLALKKYLLYGKGPAYLDGTLSKDKEMEPYVAFPRQLSTPLPTWNLHHCPPRKEREVLSSWFCPENLL